MKKTAKIIALITAIAMIMSLFTFSVSAEAGITISGSCGANASYILYDNGELVISGTGNMYSWQTSGTTTNPPPWYSYRKSIYSVVIGDGIKDIGSLAFYGSSNLQNVKIPDTVTRINGYAFNGCSSLKKIDFPKNLTTIAASAFLGCSNLTNFILPQSLKTIGNDAFNTCSTLTEVVIPNNVTTIGYYAFYNCKNLESITIYDSVTSIGVNAFGSCPKLTIRANPGSYAYTYAQNNSISVSDIVPKGSCGKDLTWELSESGLLEIYGSGAMTNYTAVANVPWHSYRDSIKSVWVYAGVTSISPCAFIGCKNLESVSIGSDVVTIGNDAFNGCAKLPSVEIPKSVKTISSYAFSNCTGLTSIKILDNVTSIGTNAFYNCPKLTIHGIPGSYAQTYATNNGISFARAITAKGTFGDYISWVVYDDGELVLSGTGEMFSLYESWKIPWYNYHYMIEKATIEEGVTTIGTYAFFGLENLKSVSIPDSVTHIDTRSFLSATKLESIDISKYVTHIGMHAFDNCNSLTSINIDPENPNYCTDSYGVLYNKDKTTLYEMYRYLPCSPTEYVVPDSVTTIAVGAFNQCTTLEKITIPASVTEINDYTMSTDGPVFGDCPNLTIYGYTGSTIHTFAIDKGIPFVALDAKVIVASGTCGDNLTWTLYDDGELVISGTGAMAEYNVANNSPAPWNSYDESINAVTIKDGVTTIGDCAFFDLYKLKSIEIPDSVTTIGKFALYSDDALESIVVSANNAYYSSQDGVLFDKNKTTLVQYPIGNNTKSYTTPDSVTTIGEYAFYGSDTIESVVVGNSVTTIENWVFGECSALESVIIGNNVTTIGYYAFYDCGRITNIEIPAGVTTIVDSAFVGCHNLRDVYVYGNTVTFGDNVFDGCRSDMILHGYAGSTTETYAAANSIEFLTLDDDISVTGITLDKNHIELETDETETLTATITPEDATNKNVLWTSSDESVAKVENGVVTALSAGNATITVTTEDGAKTATCEVTVNPAGPLTGTCGENLTWTLYDDGELVISGTGAMTDFEYECAPWYQYKESIEIVTIEDGVTSIGRYAFYACKNLYRVDAADSVTTIGERAFLSCINLNYFNAEGIVSVGDYAFYDCSALSIFGLNENATTIGTWAFYNCEALGSITIPKTVVTIGNYAFDDCTNLTIKGYSKSVAETYAKENNIPFVALDVIASGNCGDDGRVEISPNVKWVLYDNGELVISGSGKMGVWSNSSGAPWYNYRGKIKSVTIESGVTSIEGYAFYGCPYIEKITIPGTVKVIESQAIYNCTGLKELIISEGVETIWLYAFYGSSSLESVTLPSTVTAVGGRLFGGCPNLKNFVVASGNPVYASDPEGILYNKERTTLIEYYDANPATEYTVKNGVTTIGECAFHQTPAIEKIVLPDTVTTIEEAAFRYCFNLKSVTIPASVSTFGADLFTGTTNVTIYGYAGSNAQIYAQTNNIPFVALDVIAEGECGDNLTWTLYDDGELVIEGTGDMHFLDMPLDSYRASIKNVTIRDGVTTIADSAFHNCDSLVSVDLPDSVTTIGEFAFYGCDSLVSIDIPDGVTTIGERAFCFCPSLVSINLPDSVTTIGDFVFCYCDSLESVTIYARDTAFGYNVFADYSPNVTLYGYTGSTTETYATQNYIPFVALYEEISVTGISLDKDSITLEVDETETLTATITPDNATNKTVIWTSSDESVATVVDGVVYAVGVGMATITATAEDGGCSASCIVEVMPRFVYVLVEDVHLSEENITLEIGDTENLTATITPDNATNKNVTWTSSDETVATVVDGVVTAVSEGFATITVTTEDGGYTATCEVRVTPPVIASGTCGDNLTWTLYDDGELVISGTGEMWDWTSKTNSPWDSYKSSITTLTVEKGVESIGHYAFRGCINLVNLNIPYLSEIGDRAFWDCINIVNLDMPQVVTIGGYTFDGCTGLKNINMPVVTRIGDGAFNACSALTEAEVPASVTYIGSCAFGSCSNLTSLTIKSRSTAIMSDAFMYFKNLTIYGYFSSTSESYAKQYNIPFVAIDVIYETDITLDKTELVLEVGENATLVVTITPSNATFKNVTWTSSDTTVATVDDGVVTAVSEGTATITATTKYGKSVTCEITVKEPIYPAESVTLDKETLTLEIGDTETLTATITPDNATNKNVTWTSSDESVATVVDGVVTAVSAGTATITVTTEDGGYTATCEVEVLPAICEVTFDANGGSAVSEIITVRAGEPYGTLPATSKTGFTFNGWHTSATGGTKVTAETVVTESHTLYAQWTMNLPLASFSKTLMVGEKVTVEWTFYPGELAINMLSLKSSDESVVKIYRDLDNQNGMMVANIWMEAVGEGNATVTLTYGTNVITGNITVVPANYPVTGISLDKDTLTLEIGETETLTATITPDNATNKKIYWTNSDNSVIMVNDGIVTALSAGTSVVTATTEDGGYTATCTVTVNPKQSTEDAPVLTVVSSKGRAGGTVEVVLEVENNPGIALLGFELNYDADNFTLLSVTANEDVFAKDDFVEGKLEKLPYLYYAANYEDNATGNGSLVTFTFSVNEDCADGTYPVTISNLEAYTIYEDEVSFEIENGAIEIKNFIYGDVTGDGKVNRMDMLRLGKYFTGWDVEIDMDAADVTGDGKVNRMDMLRLGKYFTGWDVTLGK